MTMPTIFDVTAQPEEIESVDPRTLDGFCCECGGGLDDDGFCAFCEYGIDDDGSHRDDDGDFPLSLEYEGTYGLSGYDSFYDYSDLGSEY